MHFLSIFSLAIAGILYVTDAAQKIDNRPNILIIMADDMGFDDVSFRGSNHFLTPNIDALAYSGVILTNFYVPAMCSPSRAALLTGKYPINTGMQLYVIPNDEPWGLPTEEVTMAQIFQQHGYFTSLVGKWHQGMSRKAYTPTYRGFDHHFGYLGAYIDYWDYTLYNPKKNYSRGHDLRENLRVSHKKRGTYATRLFTEEAVKIIRSEPSRKKPLFLILSHLAPHSGNDDATLQAPVEEVAKFAYIKDQKRRTYAAMMSELDRSVGDVITALSDQGMLNNTIILFFSDNGGPTEGMHATTASNYPLRGQKNSPWEGGIRSSAAIWSLGIEKLGTVCKQRIYVADLLPTLATAAGIALDEELLPKLDGLNLWSALKYGYESVEREIVHNIADYFAYTKGKWKLLSGSTELGVYDGWLSERPREEVDMRAAEYEEAIKATSVWQQLSVHNANNSMINISSMRAEAAVNCLYKNHTELDEAALCNALNETCLFDIEADPCEQQNLYAKHQESQFVQHMLQRIEYFREGARQPNNRPTDPRCDPKYYNYEWTWWEDERNGGIYKAKASGMKLFLGVILLINYFFY